MKKGLSQQISCDSPFCIRGTPAALIAIPGFFRDTNISDKEREPLVNLLENMEMVIYKYEILGSNMDKGDTSATVYLRLVTANNINPDSSETELNVPCVKMGRHWKVKFI